ncbi:ABC transporter ATP-binding protein/permease [Sphingobium sp. H33]|uniref:ABC transporter ATP-binding protein/permease n=2 Tax=Sphingobium nicotianae TaxID=2782607 RepID=A0A9X1DDG7_9SPHN|nr:ABC transporter ATP-binding protein/permease [Sphingobium nicotianae]
MSQNNARDRTGAIRLGLGFTFCHWARHKGWVAFIAACVTVTTLTEMVVPLFAGRLTDALQKGVAGREEALHAFLAMCVLTLGPVIFTRAAIFGIIGLTLRVMQAIGREAFHRVQRLSTDWHANSFAGSTVRKITRGMWALDLLDDVLLLGLLPAIIVLNGTMVLLAWHWPVLGLAMALGSTAYIGLTVFMSVKVVSPAASLSNKWDTAMGGVLADSIGSNSVVKGFGAEAREDQRVGQVIGKWARRTRRTWIFGTLGNLMQVSLLWVIRGIVTGGAVWLWWRGEASTGDVVYVLTTYLVIHAYLRDIGQQVSQLQRSVNDMEELVRLHDEPLGIEDAPDAPPIVVDAGEIRFDHVRFQYGGHRTALYDDLDVTIPAGQRVGLVGRSGSGKTTFVKLVQRLYDVTEGRVLIDGQDVRTVAQASLRRNIAIVAQEPILFHRTLAENIAYARPEASIAEIERAAALANAHDFIERLPKGYRTLVGERGVKLSGGERQRVALARAFLADAPILILDEATSSLDSESEALIQQAIGRLMGGRTAIVIAHRLSTVRALDRILVFETGRIVEDGTHDALLGIEGGHYRTLFEHQAGTAEEVLVE